MGILDSGGGSFLNPFGFGGDGGVFGGFSEMLFGSPQAVPFQNLSVAGQMGDIFNAMYGAPLPIYGAQAASMLGEDPGEYLQGFTTKTKPKESEMFKFLQVGQNTWLDIGSLATDLQGKQDQIQEKYLEKFQEGKQLALEDFQDTYSKMAQIPALSQLFATAGGDMSSFNQKFSDAYDSMAGAALGKAAMKGTLADPLMQQNALGPLIFQKAMQEQQLEMSSQAQAQALAFGQALPASATMGLWQGQNPLNQTNPLTPGVMQSAQLFGPLNQQMGFQSNLWPMQMQQQQMGMLAGMAGTGIGYGLGGGFGGGGAA